MHRGSHLLQQCPGQIDRHRGQPSTAAVFWPDRHAWGSHPLQQCFGQINSHGDSHLLQQCSGQIKLAFTSSGSQDQEDKAGLFFSKRRQGSMATACLAPLRIPSPECSPRILPDGSPIAKPPLGNKGPQCSLIPPHPMPGPLRPG